MVKSLRSLQVGALISISCIFIRFVLDYDVTDGVLLSFPLYLTFLFPDIFRCKGISSLLFPFIINVILWLPIKKVYHSLYGILLIERYKAFFIALGLAVAFAVDGFYYMDGPGECFFGLIISIVYFFWVQHGLDVLKSSDFLSYAGIGEIEEEKNYTTAIMIHSIVLFVLMWEIQFPYNDSRWPTDEIIIPDAYVRDVSSDGKKALYMRRDDSKPFTTQKEIGVLLMDTKEKFPIRYSENYASFGFSQNDQYIWISDSRKNKEVDELLFYNWKSNQIKEMRKLKMEGISLTNYVKFNKSERFFLTTGVFASVWDYDNGKLITEYKKSTDNGNHLNWLDSSTYVFLQSHDDPPNGYEVNLSWNRILENGEIKEELKEKMTHDIENRLRRLKKRNVILKGVDEHSVCVVTSGIAANGFLYYESHIAFWNIKNETKFFSLSSGNEIMDIAFFPDKNQFIIIERMKNNRVRIEFWNLEKKEKQRTVFLQGINENTTRRQIKIINDGTKFTEIRECVKMWNIN